MRGPQAADRRLEFDSGRRSAARSRALRLRGLVLISSGEGTMAPRVTRFSGEARNAIVAATSSTFGHKAWSAFGMAARFCGVPMIEGATAFTRRPRTTTSSARATVGAATADLLAP